MRSDHFIVLAAFAAAATLAGVSSVAAQTTPSPATRLRATEFNVPLVTPSPSIAPLARTSQFTAATASGAKLSTLRGLGATSIIIVGGRPLALRDFETKMRAATLSALGPPKMTTRSGSVTGLGNLVGRGRSSVLSTAAPIGLAKPGVFRGSATTTNSGGALASILDPNYCKTHGPFVSSVKGSVTPSGYIVVEGGCFGTGGTIKLLGKFDAGALTLPVQNWDDGSITASIPTVNGVYDQKVTLQVSRDAFVSSDTMLNFVATRETLPLPGHFITATSCDQTYIQAQCVDGTGFRLELGNTFKGTDSWHVQAPTGWSLTSLTWSGAIGSVNYDGGFDRGGPSDASWTMSWSAGIARTVVQTHTILGVQVSSDTTDFYGSTYGMTVYAVGPAGTLPS